MYAHAHIGSHMYMYDCILLTRPTVSYARLLTWTCACICTAAVSDDLPYVIWCCFLQGSTEEKEQASLVLLEVLEAARIVAVMLSPIAPALARLVYLQLGFNDQDFDSLTWDDAHWGGELLCDCLYTP